MFVVMYSRNVRNACIKGSMYVKIIACMHVCMYVCIYACMYVCYVMLCNVMHNNVMYACDVM